MKKKKIEEEKEKEEEGDKEVWWFFNLKNEIKIVKINYYQQVITAITCSSLEWTKYETKLHCFGV